MIALILCYQPLHVYFHSSPLDLTLIIPNGIACFPDKPSAANYCLFPVGPYKKEKSYLRIHQESSVMIDYSFDGLVCWLIL